MSKTTDYLIRQGRTEDEHIDDAYFYAISQMEGTT